MPIHLFTFQGKHRKWRRRIVASIFYRTRAKNTVIKPDVVVPVLRMMSRGILPSTVSLAGVVKRGTDTTSVFGFLARYSFCVGRTEIYMQVCVIDYRYITEASHGHCLSSLISCLVYFCRSRFIYMRVCILAMVRSRPGLFFVCVCVCEGWLLDGFCLCFFMVESAW